MDLAALTWRSEGTIASARMRLTVAREWETVGRSIWRMEGARAGGWWRECADLTEGDHRGAGEAGGRSVGCDASGRPTVAQEGGRREGSGTRDGGVRPGRSGGSSSSSTAGLPLDREESFLILDARTLVVKNQKVEGVFIK
jgi:hypothetical protein